jgi:hypothetical protein
VQVDPALILLAGLEADLRARVGIDLAEEGELDLAREEAVLLWVRLPMKSPVTHMSNRSWPGPRWV